MHQRRAIRGHHGAGRARPRSRGGAVPALVAAVLATLLVAACSDATVTGTAEVDTASSATTAPPASTGPAATADAMTTATPGGPATVATAPAGSATTATTEAGLPGVPFNTGPAAGTVMAVVGVRYDDVLNFRTRPDPTAPIVATVPPLATQPEIRSQGQGRLLERSVWWLVTVDGRPAWANLAFLGALGTPVDVLAELTTALAGRDTADLDAVIAAIAQAKGSTDPPSRMVTASNPAGGAATFDLMGLGDDAISGQRYAITVAGSPGGQVHLASARRTDVCSRGVAGGLCV